LSVYFSFSKLFSVSCHIQILHCLCLILHVFQFPRHIPGSLVCVSDISCFSVFLTIFHILRCVFFIFHDFQFSHHTPGPTVCNSHFSSFSVFLPYSRSYDMHFSFFTFSVFLPKFHVLQCVFLIFHDFSFLAMLQVLQWEFIIFNFFQCFSPYSMSNSVCVLFFNIFQFSHQNPGPTLYICQFPRFWLFLDIFQILQCLCLI
jgi:hypothetical protein